MAITNYTFTTDYSYVDDNVARFDASRVLSLNSVDQTISQTAKISINSAVDNASLTPGSSYLFTLASGDEVQVTALGSSQDSSSPGTFSGTQSATFTVLAVPNQLSIGCPD